MVDKLFYNTVLCQTYSYCGKYLIAGNLYGHVSIFDIDKIVDPIDKPTTPIRKPSHTFVAKQNQPICSLCVTEKFLIVGAVNEILGWEFKSILSTNNVKSAWSIQIPVNRDSLAVDINSLWLHNKDNLLYAGCGDNKIHVFSLENGKLLRSLEGHTDYIHDVHGLGNQLISASEDGSVRMWDFRTKESTNKITPHSNDKLTRPEVGKWMGCATLSEDWLLCGGGPKLSLWHLRSLDVSTVFDHPKCGIHVAYFLDEHILAAGASSQVYQLSYNGDIVAEIPSTPSSVYSVVHQTTPNKIMAIAGSSNTIDICTNFSYKDQMLAFQ